MMRHQGDLSRAHNQALSDDRLDSVVGGAPSPATKDNKDVVARCALCGPDEVLQTGTNGQNGTWQCVKKPVKK
jgi:hypothetical protein